MSNLAASYTYLGRYADAIKLHEETLALRKVKLGPDHPDTAATIYDIACVHSRMIPKSGDGAKHADLAMEWLQKGRRRGLQRRGATEEG